MKRLFPTSLFVLAGMLCSWLAVKMMKYPYPMKVVL